MLCEDNELDAQEGSPRYRYQALRHGPYLRILHLQPGQAADPIKCSLQEASLDDVAGRYDALSYEWGTSTEVHAIDVDGCLLHVRPNLCSFLGIIRDREEVIRIWVDAICIDQCSVDEKNHQVQQMWSVYFKASTTRVFLNTDVNCPELWDWRWSELVAKRTLIARQATIKVLNASYWTRLWIVQEIMASNKITVHISAWKSMSWTAFFEQCRTVAEGLSKVDCEWRTEEALQKLATSGIHDLNGHSRAVGYKSVHHGRAPHRKDNSSKLRDWHELISAYGQKQCLDIRDRVYGLNGSVARPVRVDYGLHKLMLFANVMKAEDDFLQFAEQFAENVWRALGLHYISITDVQLYSNLLVRLKMRRVWTSKTAEMIIYSTNGRRRKGKEKEELFTLSAPRPQLSYTMPTLLLVVPSTLRLYMGKKNRILRHPSCCTGIALTSQQEQDVTLSSLNGLAASLAGAQVCWNSGLLQFGEATIRLSVLAYYHARTTFELQPR